MLVQQGLILFVLQTEVLEELVGQSHQLVHPDVLLLVVGDLEQVQDNFVDAHVPQKALLVFPGFDSLKKIAVIDYRYPS